MSTLVRHQLPVRVLVKGPSTALWTSMMGGPRTDLAYPRVIEQELLCRGRAAQVWNRALLGWPTRDLFKTWDEEIVAWSPDVVILAVGHYESLHIILPRWLERGANTVNRRSGLLRFLFYRRFMRLLARLVLILQRWIDRPGIKRKRRMRRVAADVEAYLKMTSQVGTPLIILLEIHGPSAAKVDWFRGWPERVRVLNQELRRIAALRDNVRFVEITDLMARFEPGTREQLWADGIHFSPEFHHAVGVKLATVVEEWAATQQHLTRP